MPNAFILSACRTPIGKFRGSLSWLPAVELGAIAVREAVSRAGVERAAIEEVIFGNVLSAGVGQAPARQAALRAGLSPQVAALTVNKVCGSGLKAVSLAAQGDALWRCRFRRRWRNGEYEPGRLGAAAQCAARRGPPALDSMMHDGLTCPFSKKSMGEIADALAKKAGISRERARSVRAGKSSPRRCSNRGRRFARRLFRVPSRRASEDSISRDEGPRADTDLAQFARLKPAFGPTPLSRPETPR